MELSWNFVKLSGRIAILGMSGKTHGISQKGKNVMELSWNFVNKEIFFVKSTIIMALDKAIH